MPRLQTGWKRFVTLRHEMMILIRRSFLTVSEFYLNMNSMKLVIPLHPLYWSIHTKDESKRGTAFAFIFGVN